MNFEKLVYLVLAIVVIVGLFWFLSAVVDKN